METTHERSSGSLPFRERETVALIMQIETKWAEEHTRNCSTDTACEAYVRVHLCVTR